MIIEMPAYRSVSIVKWALAGNVILTLAQIHHVLVVNKPEFDAAKPALTSKFIELPLSTARTKHADKCKRM
jgi:hypothetical protein